MGLLNRLKKREETQYQKMQDKNYYFSEESKKKGKQLYEDKKNYIKNNPQDYETVGANIYGILWNAIDEFPSSEREIFRLTGEGKYYEDRGEFEKAIKCYQDADDLTMIVCRHDIAELVRDNGPGDYLYCAKLRQRIRVCQKPLIKEMEVEAKRLEKVNPEEAIELYDELNRLKPGLKKYDKRIDVCKKKILK